VSQEKQKKVSGRPGQPARSPGKRQSRAGSLQAVLASNPGRERDEGNGTVVQTHGEVPARR